MQRFGDELIVAVEVNGGISLEKESQTKEAQEDHRFFLQKQLGGLYEYLGIKGQAKNEERLGYLDLINRTISLMTHEMGLLSLEKHPPDILIEVSGEGCGIFDFYKAEEIIERGRKAATRVLKEQEISY